MMHDRPRHCTAFLGATRVATGTVADVARTVKGSETSAAQLLVFDDTTSEPIELDLRGTVAEVTARYADDDAPPSTPAPRGPGRPKLGVVAREVTLLPRHWQWLATQPGGASVALRRLVEDARRSSAEADRLRLARESAYRFASAMAGNAPGFEEATRALFANDRDAFETYTVSWPDDVRAHARRLADRAFEAAP